MSKFPIKTALALLTFVGIMLIVHERVSASKGLDKSIGGEFLRTVSHFDMDHTPPLPVAPVREEDPDLTDIAIRMLKSPMLQDGSGALNHFYEALLRVEEHEKGRKVRIVHYGDSPTTADLITGDVRQLLQQKFGNAGHGFVLVGKPWAWYGHRDVEISSSNWDITTAVDTIHENNYGLGGAVFEGSPGAYSRYRLQDRSHSKIEIDYESEPDGGDLGVFSGEKELGIVHTQGLQNASGFQSVALPPNTASVELRPVAGKVRVYGISFERNAAGVTYDSLGLNGASTVVMSRSFGAKQWAEELRHRNPDLVIINYGTNEAGFGSFVTKQYEGELKIAINKIRTALPDTSILIMSPMDRGKREGTAIETMPTIPRIIEIQERVAKETGCGFFNTFEAMGGSLTMARWYEKNPPMVAADLIHPSPKGARIIAQAFVRQIMIGYYRYKIRRQHETQQSIALTSPKTRRVTN